MARVTFSTDIQSISGKLCAKEGVIYSVNKRTGKTFRSDRHVFTNPNTEQQQTIRATFKKKSQFASVWWKQNRPSKDNAAGTTSYALLMKAYKSQSKIGNPYCYMRSLVTDDLKVILSGNDLTGGVTPGGTTEGGGTQGGGLDG